MISCHVESNVAVSEVVTMTLALPEDRVAFYQCGFCSASLLVDGRNCRKTRDSQGNFNDCVLEEAAWYKGSFSIGRNAKPCCSTCIQPWPSWKTRQANKVARFWKHSHQICDGCICTLEIAGAPAIAVAAGAPVVALSADAPGVAAPAAAPTPQPVQFTPQPPPPPLQPPNFNQAMQHFRTMETKVAVLEAQIGDMQVASEVTSQKFEETMVNLQLAMESKMHEQDQRMVERLNMRDDTVQLLEAQIQWMSNTIEELQLQLAIKAREVHEDCEDTLSLPHSDVIDGKWDKVKGFNPEGGERFSNDYDAWIYQ